MASFSMRRLTPVCVSAAALFAGLALPTVASAKHAAPCVGDVEHIEGAGSTLQKLAQVSVWAPEFKNSLNTNALACNGTGSKVKVEVAYKSIGSGQGLEEWGFKGHAFEPTTDFVSTDEAPSGSIKTEIQSHGSGALNTVPVLQASIAIIVHLPKGCTATSAPAPGRLALGNGTLAKIWEGTINTWGEVVTAESATAKDELIEEEPGVNECASKKITRIVRRDGSGNTHIFKKYLSLISSKTFTAVLPETGEEFTNQTWTTIDEGTLNQAWPKEANVVRETGEGGGKLVFTVGETESSIGYSNLADARNPSNSKAFIPDNGEGVGGTGGKGKATFWAELENGSGTYEDPSIDHETSEKPTKANCEKEVYTNGKHPFPPKKTTELWNAATTSLTQTHYTLCGLTYILDVPHVDYPFGAEAAAIGKTVHDYLEWILNTSANGGQPDIEANHDYESLPSNVDAIAIKGIKKLN